MTCTGRQIISTSAQVQHGLRLRHRFHDSLQPQWHPSQLSDRGQKSGERGQTANGRRPADRERGRPPGQVMPRGLIGPQIADKQGGQNRKQGSDQVAGIVARGRASQTGKEKEWSQTNPSCRQECVFSVDRFLS
ncbi:hypothetical protein O6H91_07G050600 [Diphasiastrum complanatum]|uniref:Uncharacterized protein n=1 Tax=Diphasiastrum complanatum TaxID=34168 RepID=A0ACC2D585_DIPCM|nr:hypothetical protein O6H91_07G050600 [Diphasiastrum complanatum]